MLEHGQGCNYLTQSGHAALLIHNILCPLTINHWNLLKIKYAQTELLKKSGTRRPLLQVSENMTRASTAVALRISHTSSAGASLGVVWLLGLCFQVYSHV